MNDYTPAESYMHCMYESESLNPPVTVLLVKEGKAVTEQVSYPEALLRDYPDDTKVLGVLRTEFRSLQVEFTVGEYRALVKQRDEKLLTRLKTVKSVVKCVGPRGGFRSLRVVCEDSSISFGSPSKAEKVVCMLESLGFHSIREERER